MARCRSSPRARGSRLPSSSENPGERRGFADRLAALVERRRSQVCLGLDPDPGDLTGLTRSSTEERVALAERIVESSRVLIEQTAEQCVAVKPQLACFERLGWPGWRALEQIAEIARRADLLVIADGKRGDVPHTAAVYAEAMFGPAGGLAADACTLNPLLGGDSIGPFVAAANSTGAGLFLLARTSNPGAVDFLDAPIAGEGGLLHDRIAAWIGRSAAALRGECGLSGLGAVVGATHPEFIAGLRAAMPDSIFLLPGVGAQGGDPSELQSALAAHPASVLVPASRSIASAPDPGAAAAELRRTLARLSGL